MGTCDSASDLCSTRAYPGPGSGGGALGGGMLRSSSNSALNRGSDAPPGKPLGTLRLTHSKSVPSLTQLAAGLPRSASQSSFSQADEEEVSSPGNSSPGHNFSGSQQGAPSPSLRRSATTPKHNLG